jgi:serine protease Do
VTDASDVREAIDAAHSENKRSVLMRIRSGDASHYVAVPLANG